MRQKNVDKVTPHRQMAPVNPISSPTTTKCYSALSLSLTSFRRKIKVESKVPRLDPQSSTVKIPPATVLLKRICLGKKNTTGVKGAGKAR